MISKLSPKNFLIDLFKKNADKIFIINENYKITYNQFINHTIQVIDFFKKKNINKQDRILIKIDNSYEYLLTFLAGALGEFVVCPVDPSLKGNAYENYKKIISPNFIIDKTKQIQLYKNSSNNLKSFSKADDDDKDFIIIPTSGTTGEPKGILFSLSSYLQSSHSFSKLAQYDSNSKIYHHLPMYYNAGILNTFFSPMISGSTIILGEKLSGIGLFNFWNIPEKFGANHLHVTPSIALALCKINNLDKKFLSHIKNYHAIFSTGSKLYDSIKKKFKKNFQKDILSCYGMTEIGGPITCQNLKNHHLPNSVGSHQPEVDIKIENNEAEGVILIKSPYMMKGYLTSKGLNLPLTNDGYFVTDDVGFYEDEILHIVGRNKEIIKKGGELVSLVLIENTILELDIILNTVVIGIEDEILGEKIIAFIEFMDKKSEIKLLNSVQKYLKEKLKPVEQPDKFIIVPEIPKTGAGKAIKYKLLNMHKQQTK